MSAPQDKLVFDEAALLARLAGDAHIRRGVVEFDFANQSEVAKRAATTEPLYWTYRIHLDAPSNLRWRPPDGDLEFTADLDLEQTPDSLLIYGEMHVVKGTYYFLSNRFTVSQADITFDNQKGVDPLMEILATTSLKPNRPELASGGRGEFEAGVNEAIDAHITGRASQPVIELTSSSGWDQREILGELTYGRFTGSGGGFSATDPVENYLTRQLNNQLSRDLAKFFNDAVNQWEIQREQGSLIRGDGSVYVSVGGDVTPQISWSVRQRLPGLQPHVGEGALVAVALRRRHRGEHLAQHLVEIGAHGVGVHATRRQNAPRMRLVEERAQQMFEPDGVVTTFGGQLEGPLDRLERLRSKGNRGRRHITYDPRGRLLVPW